MAKISVFGKGTGRRYSKGARREILARIRKEEKAGKPRSVAIADAGITEPTYTRWGGKRDGIRGRKPGTAIIGLRKLAPLTIKIGPQTLRKLFKLNAR